MKQVCAWATLASKSVLSRRGREQIFEERVIRTRPILPGLGCPSEKKRKLRGFTAGEKDFFIVVLFFCWRGRGIRGQGRREIVKLNATKSNSSSTTFRESYPYLKMRSWNRTRSQNRTSREKPVKKQSLEINGWMNMAYQSEDSGWIRRPTGYNTTGNNGTNCLTGSNTGSSIEIAAGAEKYFNGENRKSLGKIDFADEFATLSINSDLRISGNGGSASPRRSRDNPNSNNRSSENNPKKNPHDRIRQARTRAARIRSRSRGKWTLRKWWVIFMSHRNMWFNPVAAIKVWWFWHFGLFSSNSSLFRSSWPSGLDFTSRWFIEFLFQNFSSQRIKKHPFERD